MAGYVMLLVMAVVVGMYFGYLFGWHMRGEQQQIDSDEQKARRECMRNHPAGKRLRVIGD